MYLRYISATVVLKIAVIGAGVVGLSSALRILEQFPAAQVVVIADKFPPNTTSNVAGGFWEPHLVGDTPRELISRWGKETFDYMVRLANSDSARYVGAGLVSGYCLSHTSDIEIPEWKDDVYNFRVLSKKEAEAYAGMKSGLFYTTVMLEPQLYLQWLMKRFQRKGGRLKKARINSLEELVGDTYDLIVNCTGVGSRHLVNDVKVEPVRGQVIRVKAPWLRHFVLATTENTLAYLLPSQSFLVMGGTEHRNNWSLDPASTDRQAIWDACTKIVPSLMEAEVDSEHVGLRPARTSVRLDLDTVSSNGKSIPVVHNYGHGGSGVTLHWGCAGHVVELVIQALKSSSASKL